VQLVPIPVAPKFGIFHDWLYSKYELLGTDAFDATIYGKTLYLFGKQGVSTKPYPTQPQLIEKIKQGNLHIKSLEFRPEEGIFHFFEYVP
jgi:hypothetical protein